MKTIECLSELIEDELSDAEKYVELALRYEDEDKETAKLFYDLSNKEMKHMQRLHDRVAAIISNYRSKNGEPPESMLAVYNYLHKKQIERAKEVKILQDMFG